MVFRVQKTKDYTVMSNYHLRDKNLSLKAKGLLSWMLSNDDDWDYSIAGIVACCKEGETTINTALRELQEFGYVKVIKVKPNKDNNRIHYEYNVYEQPQDIDSQGVESLGLESQGVENQVQRNTKESNTNIRSKNKETISKDIVEDFEFGSKKSKTKKPTLYDKCVSEINIFTTDVILGKKLIEALNMFLENSREAGKTLYTNQFKGKLNKLKELSSDTIEQRKIVQQTLDNGWNNFYELKTNKKSNNTHDRLNESGDLYVEHSRKEGRNYGAQF